MTIVTKEAVASNLPPEDSSQAAQKSGAQPSSRTDAVGVEIPVVVYASRYSATGRGLGKPLQPVREETRTVIVFPQGAVVRLSASLVVGEMVVLTNQLTGADVLCRVDTVKAQPGIQNYVDLEFTQRAPSFWGAVTPDLPARIEGAVPEPALASVVTMPAPAASIEQPAPPSPPAAEVASPTPASATPAAVTLPAVVPAAAPSPKLASFPARPALPVSNSTLGLSAAPRVTQFGQPKLTDNQAASTKQESPSSKKALWAAAGAAAAVVVVGLSAGGFLLGRRGGSATPPVQIAFAPPSAPVQSPAPGALEQPRPPVAAEPAAGSSAAPDPLAAQRPQPRADSDAGAATHFSTVHVAKLAAPVAKTPEAVRSSEPPPALVTQGSSALENMIGASLLSGAPRADAPPPPGAAPIGGQTEATGGHLQPPKLVSSPAPVYPTDARARNVEGVVVVDILVDTTGKIAETKVLSGPPMLQQAALDALRRWRYQPAQLNGQVIPIHTKVDINFALH